MNIDKIKASLPDINVMIGQKVYTGKIYGRSNDHCTICIDINKKMSIDCIVSWSTVKHYLKSGIPISITSDKVK